MSDPGGADVPRKSSEAEWLIVQAEVEMEGSAGAGARVTICTTQRLEVELLMPRRSLFPAAPRWCHFTEMRWYQRT